MSSRTPLVSLAALAALLVGSNSGSALAAPSSPAPAAALSEAPAHLQLALAPNPQRNELVSPLRMRMGHAPPPAHQPKGPGSGQPHGPPAGGSPGKGGKKGSEVVNTIFSGVYPVLNVTWPGHAGAGGRSQQFVSFIDTGSADTFAVSSQFQCLNISTQAPQPQAACGFGTLYDEKAGAFTPIQGQSFNIEYFPEDEKLQGPMGYSPIQVGGITVPKQQVALVETAAWAGDYTSSGLMGLAYPPVTSSYYANGSQAVYDPIFTTMVKEGLVSRGVFTLAVDRVAPGTPVSADAGQIAFGGLVSPKYYQQPFTTVAIEPTVGAGSALSFYSTTAELLYSVRGKPGLQSGGTFQSIVDSGTAPCFVPSAAAKQINAQFDPPATYNDTFQLWTVDCDAKPPTVAYKIGGKIMPTDPRDMIVRSLNGLPGYESTCFSAYADGGSLGAADASYIIGEVWQHSYVIAYDQQNSQLHFADRRPY